MQELHDIYDRIEKKCLTLSNLCTINLINGLFGTTHSTDSEVIYNWTEGVNDELKRTLADTIITINQIYSYHLEFQMTKDGNILLRMIEYGFHHALNRKEPDTLIFPEPLIVCLYQQDSFPDEYILNIDFGSQGVFPYKVPVYKYLDRPLQELNDKKLIILIPFQLLRLRKAIEKERTPENMAALKNLITHDILDSIIQNVLAGNISSLDADRLKRMILHLYQHIYQEYKELEEEGVNAMAEEALIFDIDILEYKYRKAHEEYEATLEKMQNLKSQTQSLEFENQIFKLHVRGKSVSEIAEQLQIAEDQVMSILDSE